jgi:AraC family transcriptional regulator of adaptative response/methylated-DNA-[protein]-cysteine methyltransferase
MKQKIFTKSYDFEQLYKALLSRDTFYDGKVFVCVTSTKIFCRLTCPARKPKKENCLFFETVEECTKAGFRACKRCSPLKPAAESDPIITALLSTVHLDPTRRWSEKDIEKMGYNLSTVRRAFKRQFDSTFLEYARIVRLGKGIDTLSQKGSVINAQHDAGFESASGFRTAFSKLLGVAPVTLKCDGILRADWIDTPLGAMVAVSDKSLLHLLEFVDRKALPTELKKLNSLVKGNLGIGRFPPIDQIETELSEYFGGKKHEVTAKLHKP